MTRTRRVALGAVAVAVVAALLELALTAIAAVSPRAHALLAPPTSQVAPASPDPRLEFRPNPSYPDHDERGFRNPSALTAADIVALGDSQTYGAGVGAAEAWPRRLQELTGYSVYSMAFGGWGATHSLVLLDEAMALQPQLIVEAFYFGNDLYDAFNMVHNRGQLPQLIDPGHRAEIATIEASQPLAARVATLYKAGDLYPPSNQLRQFFAVHSKIYGLLRAAWYTVRTQLIANQPEAAWQDAKARAAADPSTFEVFDEGGRRTIFNSAYRLAGLDLGDVRIADGLRLSLAAILEMKRRCDDRGIRFLVVLLPTKQAVFRPFVTHPTAAYTAVVGNEDQARAITTEFLGRNGIAFVDVLEPLRRQLAAGEQPYPASHDDHPNAIGHGVIAEQIRAAAIPSKADP